ncbi:glucose 1-dehydrogenase [Maribacter sp. 2307ULW6-5]|uniref:glucose 1-dehydrogenase n=1 Tax=Maribacter sp. 2307ULW6-5 TaxID=3386275 RepID=UPI0039BD5B16
MTHYKTPLYGQTAIVTGSSAGIGKAVAKTLAKAGANVTLNYRSSQEAAEEAAHEINTDSDAGTAIVVQGDVGQENDVNTIFKQTISHFGTVDICVANAGMQLDHPLHKMPLEDWEQVLRVNLTGQFLCAKAAILEFKRRGMREDVSKSLGKIIHMSSVHEIIPWAGHANYAASKGGLLMLMESICQEYGPEKIRCNSIAPGAVKTEINKDVWSNEEGREQMLKLIPYKRIGIPEDIGQVASWLASDQAEYINGTTIYVDGGMNCYPGFANGG